MEKSKMKKVKYERPIVFELGAQFRGSGATTCDEGSGVLVTLCGIGGGAAVTCGLGSGPGSDYGRECEGGVSAALSCYQTGSGGTCSYGDAG